MAALDIKRSANPAHPARVDGRTALILDVRRETVSSSSLSRIAGTITQ
jgi:hypothetical protein